MADDSIRVLNQYKQHITRACSAKQQLKRLVEQHQTCLVQLQTQQLRLRKARAAAEEAINGHAALLLQQLRERCVDALRVVAQDYSLKQLPLDSSIAILERSVRELEGVAQKLYCGLHKATAADSVDHISSLTEGLYVAVQQGEAVVVQCGQSLTRPGGWPSAKAFCGLQLASKRRSGMQRQRQQQQMPGTPDLAPAWQKAADIAARGAHHSGANGGKRFDQAAAAEEVQMVYSVSVDSSRSSSPILGTQYITAGHPGAPSSSSPRSDFRSKGSPVAQQQQQQQKVSLLPRQWRCKQRAQLRYQQHLEEQQDRHMAIQQQQHEGQQEQQHQGKQHHQGQQQAALERLAALAAAAGVELGLGSAADSCDTADWGAALPPSAFPTASTDGGAVPQEYGGAAGIFPGATEKLQGRQSRAQRQAAGAGVLQAGRQREAGVTTDTASSESPGSSGGWGPGNIHPEQHVSMPSRNQPQQQHRQQQQQQRMQQHQQQEQWRRRAQVVEDPGLAAAEPGGPEPAMAAGTAAAAAGAGPPAVAGGEVGGRGTQTCGGMVTGAAIAAGDVQGMQQQLAARSQVVQAAWEEVQQLAQRLSAGVLNE